MAEGRNIPEDLGTDHGGPPAADPVSILLKGALLPFGGCKGYGPSYHRKQSDRYSSRVPPQNIGSGNAITEDVDEIGYHFAAIDISKPDDVKTFRTLADLYIDRMKSVRTTDGTEKILIPGEPEFRNEADKGKTVLFMTASRRS